jgi:hypothetical protein
MLARLGNFLVEMTDTRRGRILFVSIVSCIAGLLEYFVHRIIDYFVDPAALVIVLDSLTIAFVIAALTTIEIQAVQQRRRKVNDDVRIVRELNHHVRNALQIIQYASRLPEERRQVEIIDESVARIDTTLKELFPSSIDEPASSASANHVRK